MKLTRAEVDHIAELAKLELTEEEKEKFREQLSAILEYAEMLQRLDTEAIPPTATVLPYVTSCGPTKLSPPSRWRISWPTRRRPRIAISKCKPSWSKEASLWSFTS